MLIPSFFYFVSRDTWTGSCSSFRTVRFCRTITFRPNSGESRILNHVPGVLSGGTISKFSTAARETRLLEQLVLGLLGISM